MSTVEVSIDTQVILIEFGDNDYAQFIRDATRAFIDNTHFYGYKFDDTELTRQLICDSISNIAAKLSMLNTALSSGDNFNTLDSIYKNDKEYLKSNMSIYIGSENVAKHLLEYHKGDEDMRTKFELDDLYNLKQFLSYNDYGEIFTHCFYVNGESLLVRIGDGYFHRDEILSL